MAGLTTESALDASGGPARASDIEVAQPRTKRRAARCCNRRILVAPELPVSEARQVERPEPELMPSEFALGVVDDAAVQA